MIAGHALAADCVLITNNLREFSRVKGLRTETRKIGQPSGKGPLKA